MKKNSKIKYTKSFLEHAKKHNFSAEEMEQAWLYEEAIRKNLTMEPRKENKLRKAVAQASANFSRKDERVNIRISSHDLNQVKYRAMKEGLPYQTFISSILHKFISGSLS